MAEVKTYADGIGDEKKYLAGNYNGDPQGEYLKFFRAGVDGVFTDGRLQFYADGDAIVEASYQPDCGNVGD